MRQQLRKTALHNSDVSFLTFTKDQNPLQVRFSWLTLHMITKCGCSHEGISVTSNIGGTEIPFPFPLHLLHDKSNCEYTTRYASGKITTWTDTERADLFFL